MLLNFCTIAYQVAVPKDTGGHVGCPTKTHLPLPIRNLGKSRAAPQEYGSARPRSAAATAAHVPALGFAAPSPHTRVAAARRLR